MACFYHYRRAEALACLDVSDWSIDLDLDLADAFPWAESTVYLMKPPNSNFHGRGYKTRKSDCKAMQETP